LPVALFPVATEFSFKIKAVAAVAAEKQGG
jgi:hypothetical protein